MDTLAPDAQWNEMIIQCQSVDALHQLYAEDVVAQENDEPERVGRAAWLTVRQAAEQSIKTFQARVLAHAANGDTSFSEWEYNVAIERVGALTIVQVAV